MGSDKAFVEVGGVPMVQRVIAALVAGGAIRSCSSAATRRGWPGSAVR